MGLEGNFNEKTVVRASSGAVAIVRKYYLENPRSPDDKAIRELSKGYGLNPREIRDAITFVKSE